ncbi:MAG: PAS domain S-box protein, partial [Spirochaetaceae bacterium]|nr:PAS domain S-box protein [Spirochaetaceae bacterium]
MKFSLRIKSLIILAVSGIIFFAINLPGITRISKNFRMEQFEEVYTRDLFFIDLVLADYEHQVAYDMAEIYDSGLFRKLYDTNSIRNYLDGPDNSNLSPTEMEAALIDELNQYRVINDEVIYIYVAFDDGSFVMNEELSPSEPYDPRTRPWYIHAKQTPGDVVMPDPYHATNSNYNFISFSKTFEVNKDVSGVIGFDIDLSRLPDIIPGLNLEQEGLLFLDQAYSVVVVDMMSGDLIFVSNESGSEHQNLYDQVKTIRKSDNRGLVSFRDTEYYIFFNSENIFEWDSFYLIPESVVSGKVKSFVNSIQTILVLPLVFIFLIGFLSIFFLYSTPIRKLTKGILKINSDKPDPSILPTPGNDEIGMLNETFRSLLIQLNNHSENLENRIYERTIDLENAQVRTELLLNSAGEGILGVDNTGKIIFSNPMAEELLEYSHEELFDSSILDILSFKSGINQNELRLLERSYLEGISQHIDRAVFSTKNNVLLNVDVHSTPVIKSDLLNGAVISFMDITHHLELESIIETSKIRLQSLIEALPTFVYIFNRDGIFIEAYANDSVILESGLPGSIDSVEKLVGLNISDVLSEDQSSDLKRIIIDVIDHQKFNIFQHSIMTDRGLRWFNGHLSPLVNNIGEMSHAVYVSSDITELINARKLAEQAVEVKSSF